ncbi:hypothetical protein [Streptomyces cyaneofuscatus]|uniref:hypothetical protein n=1 Tax=Streptomyces cyaneofuscatus TaxID=66883 RepID=UPI0037FCD94B
MVQHFISNVLVEFSGQDSADAESYCLCFLWQKSAEPGGKQGLAVIRCPVRRPVRTAGRLLGHR